MSTQKRKVGVGYDLDAKTLCNSDSTRASAKRISHEMIFPTKRVKMGGPRISSMMRPKHPSAMGIVDPSTANSEVTGTARDGTNSPDIPRQPPLNIHAEFKDIHRKLDILLAWVGKLKKGVTSQLEKQLPAPPMPKTIRRAATFSDFHHN